MKCLARIANHLRVPNMEDERLIKSYVWHGDKCFYVSTIERDSSAMLGPGRFNETLVWEFDWDKNERNGLIGQDGGTIESLQQHFAMCERLYKTGSPVDND